MVRRPHGAPAPKRAAKKKTAKKAGKSLRERAAAKKLTKKIADSLPQEPLAASSTAARLAPTVVVVEPGEDPVDTLGFRKVDDRKGAQNQRTPIDDERSGYRKGPLTVEWIDDICRHLRYGLHRTTTERLMGFGKGRIGAWVKRSRANRAELDAWQAKLDDAIEAGLDEDAAIASAGPGPDVNMFALLHACMLTAEAKGEQSCVGAIVNAAIEGDWRANAWFLSRRYGKRWGEAAAKGIGPEEDDETAGEEQKKSSVERLAGVLEEMFGRRAAIDESEEGIPR